MITIDDKVIGRHLCAARKNLKLTQEQVASRLDVSTSYYARLERGSNRINLEKLLELSVILQTPVADFLSNCCEEYTWDGHTRLSTDRENLARLGDMASPELLRLMCVLCEALYKECNQ